jgi:hypothetical protein
MLNGRYTIADNFEISQRLDRLFNGSLVSNASVQSNAPLCSTLLYHCPVPLPWQPLEKGHSDGVRLKTTLQMAISFIVIPRWCVKSPGGFLCSF